MYENTYCVSHRFSVVVANLSLRSDRVTTCNNTVFHFVQNICTMQYFFLTNAFIHTNMYEANGNYLSR